MTPSSPVAPGGHTHGGAPAPVGRHVRLVLGAAVLLVLVATVLGLVALWPHGSPMGSIPLAVAGTDFRQAEVLSVDLDAATARIRLLDPPPGADAEATASLTATPDVLASGIGAGDRIRVFDISGAPSVVGPPYVFVDFVRDAPIALLAVGYALVVVLVARWRGLAALVGLGLSLALVAFFTLPALLDGRDALLVGLVTASATMVVVLYLAHGFSARTTTALLGTMAGLAVTGALAAWATGAAHLSRMGSEEATVLPSYAPEISLRGIVLCGIVLGGLGVLNDVTITQASAVWELRAALPDRGPWELFARAMRIGRDHIASTVYTVAFAYVGAALPVILTVSLYDRSLLETLTSGEFAEEVVRTLVGSIGLVLAIPLTTAIAALVVAADRAEPRAGATVPPQLPGPPPLRHRAAGPSAGEHDVAPE